MVHTDFRAINHTSYMGHFVEEVFLNKNMDKVIKKMK